MREPGKLIASGRDADIFEYGPGLVLRRAREARSLADEARIMEYVHQQGYPVPAIEEVSDDGHDIVMERVDGPQMVAALAARPWTIPRQADTLATLHLDLHEIAAPSWVHDAPCTAGDRMVHLDLHPLNVILGPRGPVVIDWSGAARGHPSTDVALTWILLVAGQVEANLVMRIAGRTGRRLFVSRFLRHFDRAEVATHLREVVEWKTRDPHMSPVELAAMRALAASQ